MARWIGRVRSAHFKFLRLILRSTPISLRYWLFIRKIFALWIKENPIAQYVEPEVDQKLFPFPLQPLFDSVQTGSWAVDHDSLVFLWKTVNEKKPKIIFEFGSGLSTILFRAYCRDQVEKLELCNVISLEQDEEYQKIQQNKLSKMGLDNYGTIYYAPLDAAEKYQFDPMDLLQNEKIDFVFIDGPAGHDNCRFPTLLSISSYCNPGAVWFLDDALRDSELQTISGWAKAKDILIQGIIPIGKGLAQGIVQQI